MKRFIILTVTIIQISVNSGALKKYIQVSDQKNKMQFKILKIER